MKRGEKLECFGGEDLSLGGGDLACEGSEAERTDTSTGKRGGELRSGSPGRHIARQDRTD